MLFSFYFYTIYFLKINLLESVVLTVFGIQSIQRNSTRARRQGLEVLFSWEVEREKNLRSPELLHRQVSLVLNQVILTFTSFQTVIKNIIYFTEYYQCTKQYMCIYVILCYVFIMLLIVHSQWVNFCNVKLQSLSN